MIDSMGNLWEAEDPEGAEEIPHITISDVMNKIRDLYPLGDVCVGGSSARNYILKNGLLSRDVDIYMAIGVTRYMFEEILHNIVFKGVPIAIDTPRGDPKYYKMPHMRRLVTVSFPLGNLPDLDFIFLNPSVVTDVSGYLMKNQASTISQCCLKTDYTLKGFTKVTSNDFDKAFRKEIPAYLNNHPSVCTPEQADKVVRFCKDNSIELRTKSLERDHRAEKESIARPGWY